MRDWLAGRKTYFTVAAAVLAVLIAWISGEVTDFQAVQSAVGAILIAFVRSGSKADATAVAYGKTPR